MTLKLVMNGCVVKCLGYTAFKFLLNSVFVYFIVFVCETSLPFLFLSLARGRRIAGRPPGLKCVGVEDRGCEGWRGVTSEGEDSNNA